MTALVPVHQVVFFERGFGGKVRRMRVPYGTSIAHIWLMASPFMDATLALTGEIRVNGDVVPRHLWACVRTRWAGRDVRVHIDYEFGKGSALSTTIQIAALVAAIAVSGGALAPLGSITFAGSFLASGTLGASLVASGILAGAALVNYALAAPPSLAAIAAQGLGAEQNVQNAASLSGNILSPGAPLPRVIGTMRVHPQIVCPVFLELDGDDEIGEVVLALGGPHALADIWSGKTDIDDIEGMEIETSEGLTAAVPTLITRQTRTDQPQIEFSRHQIDKDTSASNRSLLSDQATPTNSLPKWHRVVSRAAVDEIWLTLGWSQGLVQTTNLGGNCAMPLRLRMRPRGDSTWRNLPEIHFVNSKIDSFKKEIRLIFGAQPFSFPQPPLLESPYAVYRAVSNQTVNPTSIGSWTAHTSFNNGTGSVDVLWQSTTGTTRVTNVHQYPSRVEIYLDHADFVSDEPWEVEIMAGSAYRYSEFNVANYTLGGNRYDMFGYEDNGTSDVALYNMYNFNYRCDLIRFASIWNENPVAQTGDAWFAIKFRNRALEKISVLASGYVYDWDETAQSWSALYTGSNPIPHYVDVLKGALNAYPVEEGAIDNDVMVAARQHCTDESLTCNMIVEGRSVDDVLTAIASCANGRPLSNEGRSIMIDKDVSAETPVQYFSPRNSRGFRFDRALAQRPDGFRARFSDSAQDYEEREIIVLDPGGTDGGRYEDIRIDGLVSEAAVEARAERMLKELRLRMSVYQFETNLQHVKAIRGDLVGLSHHILSEQHGYAYVTSVQDDGAGNITGITLDGTVKTAHFFTNPGGFFSSFESFFTDNSIGVVMRLKDGTILTKQVSSYDAETDTLVFSTPFADPGVNGDGEDILGDGVWIATGPLDEEVRRAKVWSVTPKAGGLATVTCVDEAPALHA